MRSRPHPAICSRSRVVRHPAISLGSTQQGHVLLASLVALVLLAVAATLIFSVVANGQRHQLRTRQQLDLRAMNDAVIAETLAELHQDTQFRGVRDREMGAGRVGSEVIELSRTRSQIDAYASLGPNRFDTELVITTGIGGPRVLAWRRVNDPED